MASASARLLYLREGTSRGRGGVSQSSGRQAPPRQALRTHTRVRAPNALFRVRGSRLARRALLTLPKTNRMAVIKPFRDGKSYVKKKYIFA